MTMLDEAEVEARVRTALHAVAERTSLDVAYEAPPARRPRLLAAAAAILLVVAGVAVLRPQSSEDRPRATSSTTTSSTSLPVPTETPLVMAGPVFRAEGGATDVAEAYLRDRFPDRVPALHPVDENGSAASFRWTGDVYRGRLRLSRIDGTWAVVEATTDGVFFDRVTIEDGRLKVRVLTDAVDSLFADVLTLDGEPVPGSPAPEGFGGASYRFGTAGGPAGGALDVDVPVIDGGMVVRAELVGGTILAVAEIRVRPVAEGRLVVRDAWAGGEWAIRAADAFPGLDGSPCAWVEVEDVSPQAVCGLDASSGTAFHVIGPVAVIGGERLVFAAVGADVADLRVGARGVAVHPDPANPDGARFTAFVVEDGGRPVVVEALDPAGQVLGTAEVATTGSVGG